ncbi:MAG: DNA adenine methylase [Bdellovibrionales bacterium]|nr:DNA adenine methylase [Bdellovibrionales bacterium]MCB0413129.1 DNA adenine methylase [Bdellovibrionales bacterium]
MQLELFRNKETNKIVNVASVPQRSPFRYPGGKTWFVPTLRRWLMSKSRAPELLVEPFAGGGIVGLTAAFDNLAKKVLLVELDEEVAAVWKILVYGDYEKLAKKILNFEMTLENAKRTLEKKPRSTDERAFQTILRNRVSHGGIMAPGSGLIKNGENGRGISSRWYPETLAKRIMSIGTIRSKLEFKQGDAFEAIEEFLDDKQTVYFVDPPYTAAGKRAGRRLYSHHELDHEKLFSTFKKAKGDFIFTYDDSEELKQLAQKNKFQTQLIPMKNTHHAKMTELVIGKDLKWLS